MAKRKKTKGHTIIYKTLHRKLYIKQHVNMYYTVHNVIWYLKMTSSSKTIFHSLKQKGDKSWLSPFIIIVFFILFLQNVNNLSIDTRKVVKGNHSRKTANFVRVCTTTNTSGSIYKCHIFSVWKFDTNQHPC